MLRSMMCSLVALNGFVSLASAADDNTDPKAKEAKITKVDPKAKTSTVKMKAEGKDVEKTFKLAEEIEYMDSTGNVAAIDIFTAGDMVFLAESDGQITKMKNDKEAKITAIDAKKHSATVQMKEAGKDVEKTFKLNRFVDFFISSCFVHKRKPDANIFRLALDVAQTPVEQVLYIENTPMFVEIAEGLGIQSIFHTDYKTTCAKLASFGLGKDLEVSHETR